MSILKIKDICLVTGLSNDNGECRAAYDWMKEKNLDFQHLSYYEPGQHDELFANYNTWVPGMNLNRFPFVHYTEIDSFCAAFMLSLTQICHSKNIILSLIINRNFNENTHCHHLTSAAGN